MIESTTLLVLAILALIAASYGYFWYSPAPPLPPLSATIRKNGVRAGGRDRSYLLYVPIGLPPRAALVIVLHGSGMDGTRMRICTGYQFECLADQLGFVVLYPEGYRRNWNDCRKDATFSAKRENIDDMSFIRATRKNNRKHVSVAQERQRERKREKDDCDAMLRREDQILIGAVRAG
jgi:polyhydroxybutyrate depolymerase